MENPLRMPKSEFSPVQRKPWVWTHDQDPRPSLAPVSTAKKRLTHEEERNVLSPAQGHATMGPKEEVGLTAARGGCVSTLVSSRRTIAGPGGKVHGVFVISYASNIDPQVGKAEDARVKTLPMFLRASVCYTDETHERPGPSRVQDSD